MKIRVLLPGLLLPLALFEQIPSESKSAPVVSGIGERTELKLEAGRLSLELTAVPKYVALGKRAALKSGAR